jgi:hypothetical protein
LQQILTMSDQLTNTPTEQPTVSLDQQMMQEAMKQQGFVFNEPAPATEQTQVEPTVQTEQPESQTQQAPQPEVKAEPQVDYTSFIEKEFGTKDVQTIKDRFSKYETLEQELNQLKGQPKYRTSVAETIDGLLEGVSATEQPKVLADIARFMSMDESQLSPKDLIGFDLKLKYPTIEADQLEALINKRYGLGDLATDEERKAGEAQMHIDSLDARKNIAELKAKTLSTNPAKAKADLAGIEQEKKVAQYNQLTESSLKNFKTISLKTDKVDIADFVVDTKAVEQIKADVANAMVAGGFDATEENVHHIASALYKVNNFEHILNHVATQLQSNQLKKEVADYHNADPKGGAVIQQKPLTPQEIEVKIAQQMGIL